MFRLDANKLALAASFVNDDLHACDSMTCVHLFKNDKGIFAESINGHDYICVRFDGKDEMFFSDLMIRIEKSTLKEMSKKAAKHVTCDNGCLQVISKTGARIIEQTSQVIFDYPPLNTSRFISFLRQPVDSTDVNLSLKVINNISKILGKFESSFKFVVTGKKSPVGIIPTTRDDIMIVTMPMRVEVEHVFNIDNWIG